MHLVENVCHEWWVYQSDAACVSESLKLLLSLALLPVSLVTELSALESVSPALSSADSDSDSDELHSSSARRLEVITERRDFLPTRLKSTGPRSPGRQISRAAALEMKVGLDFFA
jgi:hypothetical protein